MLETMNARKCILRWRFDYSDSKPSKFGYWMNSGDDDHGKASLQDKTNLLRACIEGKDIKTRKTICLTECDGHEFVNFQWLAYCHANINIKGTVKLPTMLVGMAMITTDYKILVYSDGRINVEKRTEVEKSQNLAGFGQ